MRSNACSCTVPTSSFWGEAGIVYDNNGNRLSVTGNNGAPYSPNNLNQYEFVSGIGGLHYNDGKGNLTGREDGWSYSYDAQNRLVEIDNGPGGGTYIEFKYDGLNRVIASDSNNEVTSYVWDNWNLIEEMHGGWPIKRCYLNGAQQNEMVAAFDGNVYGTHWYWQDGRGNTSHITGDNNYLLERYTYDLEGRPAFYHPQGFAMMASNYDTRFLFAGSLYIPEANLYDMRNRYYSTELNRFLQTDPAGFKGDALNLYRYCANDPINHTDPSGLQNEIEIERIIVFAPPVSSDDFGITSYSPDFGAFAPGGSDFLGTPTPPSQEYSLFSGNVSLNLDGSVEEEATFVHNRGGTAGPDVEIAKAVIEYAEDTLTDPTTLLLTMAAGPEAGALKKLATVEKAAARGAELTVRNTISAHAAARFAERGISESMVDNRDPKGAEVF